MIFLNILTEKLIYIKNLFVCKRWSYEPFYGYGIGFRSRHYRASSEQLTSSSLSSSLLQSSASVERSRRELSRARSVTLEQNQSELRQQSSIDTNRSRRARSIDIVSRYASDDCLMRSTALNSAANAISARARSASRDIMETQSLTSKTLHLDNRNVLHGRTLDERYYLDYPKQHLVCPLDCPLHNSPEWRRRFLIGNRFLDAAALGGFDVLYDPTVYRNSRRLLAKLSERSEYDADEISIQRNIESESSRRRVRATASMAWLQKLFLRFNRINLLSLWFLIILPNCYSLEINHSKNSNYIFFCCKLFISPFRRIQL